MFVCKFSFLLKQLDSVRFYSYEYVFVVKSYSMSLITIYIYDCVHMYLSYSEL